MVLAERPDALWYPTVHFGAIDELRAPLLIAESGLLRLGLTDPGSVNLGGVDDQGVPIGRFVYANSFNAIARAFDICREQQLGPSLAIYEPGFLRATLAYWRAGRLPAGAMVKLYFSTDHGLLGAPFGLPPTALALEAYLELLAGCDCPGPSRRSGATSWRPKSLRSPSSVVGIFTSALSSTAGIANRPTSSSSTRRSSCATRHRGRWQHLIRPRRSCGSPARARRAPSRAPA